MLALATRMNTISPTAASPPDRPSCASPAPAASERARFFGLTALRTRARPAVFTGVSESMEAIHLGCGGGSVAAWSARQFFTASTTRSTPSPSLIQ